MVQAPQPETPVRPRREASRRAPPAAVRKGDLVRHQTGGPVMLVSMISQDLAYCLWFSDAARLCSGTFMTDALVNVDREKRQPVPPTG